MLPEITLKVKDLITNNKQLILKAFLLSSFLPFALLSREIMCDAVYVSWAIILIGIAILHFSDYKFNTNKKLLIPSIILSTIFLLMLSIVQIIESEIYDFSSITKSVSIYTSHTSLLGGLILLLMYVFYLPSIIISTFVTINQIVTKYYQNKDTQSTPATDKNKYECLVYTAIISFFALFSVFPCVIFTADSLKVWMDATGIELNGKIKWEDWFSFGNYIFVYLCSKTYPSPFTICIVQTLIWLVVNYYIFGILQQYGKKAMRIYALLITIVFSTLYSLQDIRHDTIFSIGFLGVVAAFFKIMKNETITQKDFIFLTFISTFVLLMRHAGDYLIFTLCAILIVYGYKKDKPKLKYYIFYTLIQTSIYIFVYVFLFNALNCIKNPEYVKYGTPMMMVSGAIKDGVELSQEDKQTLETVMPLKEWENNYDKYLIDKIDRPWQLDVARYINFNKFDEVLINKGFGKFLIKLNLKLLVTHPYIYIKNFLSECNIIWNIARPKDCYLAAFSFVAYDKDVLQENAFYGIENHIVKLNRNFPLLQIISARGGFWLFVLITATTFIIIDKKYKFIFALSPIYIYTAMLMLAIPMQDMRYIMPFVYSGIFILTILISKSIKQ